LAGCVAWADSANTDSRFVATPVAALEAAVLAAAPGYTKKAVADSGEPGPARYVHDQLDLKGDGRAEVVVFVMGPVFCGARGCTLMVFSEDRGRYTLVKQFSDSLPPLIVSAKRTRGWNDLMRVESHRGAAPTYMRYGFDGKTYVEVERTAVTSNSPEGKRLLAGELGPGVGAPLSPRD
jgi:hypothetical protein